MDQRRRHTEPLNTIENRGELIPQAAGFHPPLLREPHPAHRPGIDRLAAWEREDDSLAYRDADTLRLAKRLRKHRDGLFTFLDKPEVPFDNNLAERAIRPVVILRKNSQSNHSEHGAATQAVLMSICRTLKRRGLDPTKTITAALRTCLQTGQLPPLPQKAAANG